MHFDEAESPIKCSTKIVNYIWSILRMRRYCEITPKNDSAPRHDESWPFINVIIIVKFVTIKIVMAPILQAIHI